MACRKYWWAKDLSSCWTQISLGIHVGESPTKGWCRAVASQRQRDCTPAGRVRLASFLGTTVVAGAPRTGRSSQKLRNRFKQLLPVLLLQNTDHLHQCLKAASHLLIIYAVYKLARTLAFTWSKSARSPRRKIQLVQVRTGHIQAPSLLMVWHLEQQSPPQEITRRHADVAQKKSNEGL